MGGGVLQAQGDDWMYLIADDSRRVVLTRFDPGVPHSVLSVARQAALYAVSSGGDATMPPGVRHAVTARFRRLAQQYEAGIDIDSEPAWRHGYVPEGP
jgi:hypothetical protein